MKTVLCVLPVEERHKAVLESAGEGCRFVYTSAKDVSLEQVREADAILGNVPAKLIQASPRLELVQLFSAGADPYIVPGVLDARQYTVPIQAALDAARSGAQPELTARQKHLRECYVVAAEGADLSAIETAIKTMPNYFADYDTTVTFITAEEMRRDHAGLDVSQLGLPEVCGRRERQHDHKKHDGARLGIFPELMAVHRSSPFPFAERKKIQSYIIT